MILINALGCKETGARRVAIELLRSYPDNSEKGWLIVSDTKADYALSNSIRVFVLPHSLFGRYLRPVFEVLVNLILLFPIFRLYLNLSHYGLCWFGHHHLYVHSPELVSENPSFGFKDGKINFFKSYCFKTCLRRARRIFVQTDHMEKLVIAMANQVCEKKAINITRLRPLWDFSFESKPESKVFEFQFFYPTSPFSHKRADLAIHAISSLSKKGYDCGLRITIPSTSEEGIQGVEFLGQISHSRVISIMRSSDALIFTSEKETLGLPILEAMSLGIPVVAPRLAYAMELLADSGIYFEPGDLADLVDSVELLFLRKEFYSNSIQKRFLKLRRECVSWSAHWDYLIAKH